MQNIRKQLLERLSRVRKLFFWKQIQTDKITSEFSGAQNCTDLCKTTLLKNLSYFTFSSRDIWTAFKNK